MLGEESKMGKIAKSSENIFEVHTGLSNCLWLVQGVLLVANNFFDVIKKVFGVSRE